MKRQKNNKIFLFGWNNMINVGDDIMTNIMLKKFSKNGNNVFVCRTGPFNLFDEFYHKISMFSLFLPFFYKFDVIRRRLISLNLILACVLGDKLILGGGNLLHGGKFPRKLIKILTYTKFINPNMKLEIFNIGLEPEKNILDELNLVKLLRMAQSIVVRDNYSSRLLLKYQIPHKVKIDIVFDYIKSIKSSFVKISHSKKVRIAVIPRASNFDVAMVNYIRDNFELSNKYEINMFQTCASSINSENDLSIISFFNSKLKGNYPVNLYDGNWFKWSEKIYNHDIVISQRLHGMIISDSLGIPWFGFSYHEKCKSYIQMSQSNIGEIL